MKISKELKENSLNQNDLESDEDVLYNNKYNCEYYTNDEFNQKISTVHVGVGSTSTFLGDHLRFRSHKTFSISRGLLVTKIRLF